MSRIPPKIIFKKKTCFAAELTNTDIVQRFGVSSCSKYAFFSCSLLPTPTPADAAMTANWYLCRNCVREGGSERERKERKVKRGWGVKV